MDLTHPGIYGMIRIGAGLVDRLAGVCVGEGFANLVAAAEPPEIEEMVETLW